MPKTRVLVKAFVQGLRPTAFRDEVHAHFPQTVEEAVNYYKKSIQFFIDAFKTGFFQEVRGACVEAGDSVKVWQGAPLGWGPTSIKDVELDDDDEELDERALPLDEDSFSEDSLEEVTHFDDDDDHDDELCDGEGDSDDDEKQIGSEDDVDSVCKKSDVSHVHSD